MKKKRETKVEKEYLDTDFGFNVVLTDVPMIKIHGEWVLDINHAEFSNEVLKELLNSSHRLTGNHTRFIRTKLEMTLQEFGSQFGVAHSAVMKWEETGDAVTKMHICTERDIRLFAHDKVFGGTGLVKLYHKVQTVEKQREAISEVCIAKEFSLV
ncbi:MAG: hypothetical protein AAF518_05705 [Spirochaetota bacterium]